MIRLLKETCSGGSLPKFTDLIMKCIWRNVKVFLLETSADSNSSLKFVCSFYPKVMPDKSDEIDYELVLLEIHGFMSALPQAWWNNRPSDTPIRFVLFNQIHEADFSNFSSILFCYRTVKTIIHNIAKLKGRDILLHTNKIPQSSELYAYLLKALKVTHLPFTVCRQDNLRSPSPVFPYRPFKRIMLRMKRGRKTVWTLPLRRDKSRNRLTNPCHKYSNWSQIRTPVKRALQDCTNSRYVPDSIALIPLIVCACRSNYRNSFAIYRNKIRMLI